MTVKQQNVTHCAEIIWNRQRSQEIVRIIFSRELIPGARSTVVQLGTSIRMVVGSNPAPTELASTVVRS